jgi:pilus assembly protein CpaF
VHERLLRSLDLRRLNVERMDDGELRSRTRAAVEEIVRAMQKAREIDGVDTEALIDEVLHEALGLGPLEELLSDDSVTEILVNGPSQVWVEREGKLTLTDRRFSSDQAVLGVIERIVAPIGRRVDESSPMVDARLKDGSRVNAIVPPLSLRGPCLTIRKFTREPMQIDDLVAKGTLTAEIATFLETCVKARKNMVISGGTGSGKTTTLNVLSSFIPEGERIITIEDAAELKLEQPHVVSLESRPPNVEGKGAIAIRDLVRNALRMRPDRIVVGECRGGEALDMLQAMNTGHDGSLTTVHANGPRDALSRLETMVLMSGMELPLRAIRDQIASAVDIVVQQIRFPDGSRKVTHVSEITGIEGDVIAMQDLFVFEQKGFDADGRVTGRYRATGVIPRFYETLKAMGIKADLSIFQKD